MAVYTGDVAKFRGLVREINIMQNIGSTLTWDIHVNLPPKAGAARAEVMGFLSEKQYALKTAPELVGLCGRLAALGDIDQITAAMVKKTLKDYDRLAKVPLKLFSEYVEHKLKTELLLKKAREKSDYAMLKNNLEKQFDFKRKFAECYGYPENPMDALVDELEEGMTTAKLDVIFAELKTAMLSLMEKINSSGAKHDRTFLFREYPIEKQREFCRLIVAAVGYDFEAGRLDESAHPFSFGNDKTDVRMTTRYFGDNFLNAALASMHEMGHSVYAQNCSDELRYTTLSRSASFGWDEGQSRFFENIVGRSKPFWTHFLSVAKTYFTALDGITLDEFYNSLNAVYLNPLRLSADEVTYNLHIIIRYELEKMIFAKQIGFDDLPTAWNQKYRDYLGVTPKNDAEGLLQDIHWAGGFIGAFQNYVLGNCYDGHILSKMKREIPDMNEQMSRGKFDEIFNWQVRNVHVHGSLYSPAELLERLTGEELSPKHYIDYLNQKYAEIYGL